MAKANKIDKSQIIAASITAAATLLRERLKDVVDPHETAGSVIGLASAIYTVACLKDWSSKEPATSNGLPD